MEDVKWQMADGLRTANVYCRVLYSLVLLSASLLLKTKLYLLTLKVFHLDYRSPKEYSICFCRVSPHNSK
jgi:hypothetical protein